MKHAVRKELQAMRSNNPAGPRVDLSLFMTLLLAICMASINPSVAKAAEDAWYIEPMESEEVGPVSNDKTEKVAEGASELGEDDASKPPSATSDDDQLALSEEIRGGDVISLSAEASSATEMVFRDGMAQPVFKYSDARADGYTNANSELWRFCVYVESDYDTDLDGKCDLVKVYVQIPRAAVQSGKSGWKAPVLYEARPYNGGMATELNDVLGFASPELDDAAFAKKPAKRVARSSMSTSQLALDTKRSNPQVWDYSIPKVDGHLPENFRFYDYYLVRGYAIVQTAGPGSYGSEGLVCTGTQMERDAFAGVIEWICGKRAAFADKEGTISVSASDWASGKVGMIGHSYAGSVAYEVATTGVEGLETIIPEAGPSSWYSYVNSQGICTEKTKSYDYMNFISTTCTSRLAFNDGEDPGYRNALERYKQYRSFVRNQQVQLQGDFGPFWEAREWSTKKDGINASALIVAGLNDDNVTTRQSDYLRDAILASGQNAKVIFHQNAHGLPFDQDDAVDLGMGRHTYAEWVNLWLAHELCDVSNDVDSMSDFLVQSNVDGSFYESEAWNDGAAVTLRPNGEGEVTVCAKGASYDNASLLQKTFTGKQSENAALWSLDVGEQFTIAGKIPVHVRAKVDNVGEGDKMMCAVLVDAADAPFATYAMGAMPQTETVRERDESKGPADAYSTVSWKQVQASRKIVTFGRMDLRNPEAGYDPASATKRGQPIEANVYYDYTIWLDPTYYTVQAGHRLELYIVPFCGFAGKSEVAGEDVTPLMAEASGTAAMNLNQDYTITIQNDTSIASVPTTKKVTDQDSNVPDDETGDKGDSSDPVSDPAPVLDSSSTDEPTRQQTASTGSLPRTGDDSHMGAPVVLAIASIVVACAATLVRVRVTRGRGR